MERFLLILSRKSDYGLRAALELARQYDTGLVPARRIAQSHDLPAAFVKKLMQALGRAGLVRAVVGQQGGYALARSPDQISIREVLAALEGDLAPVSCLAPDVPCELTPVCPTRHIWNLIDQRVQEVLASLSLKDALDIGYHRGGSLRRSQYPRRDRR